ncbi:fungal-specific transcription factor domain-containing protein [Aspergillus ambiguus]|uniref:transcription factor domain-containing protein n=1 Tax=Aspergillus ambiguus TaxID=176160 RepID=UPI003CCD7645
MDSPASRTTTACGACHRRKIKCDGGSPKCGQCIRRGTRCEPHSRTRRAGLSVDEERRLRQRIAWLERQLGQICGLSSQDVENIPTGETIIPQCVLPDFTNLSPKAPNTTAYGGLVEDESQSNGSDVIDKEVGDIAANVAVLSLNATGEMRFMGGASGVLFSRLIASTVKKYLYDSGLAPNNTVPSGHSHFSDPQHAVHGERHESDDNTAPHLLPPWHTAVDLLETYLQQVHTMYPIFHRKALNGLVQSVYQEPSSSSAAHQTILYLVMAIGAWHRRPLEDEPAPRAAYAAELFHSAMHWFDRLLPLDGVEGLQIVLLLAIYASCRPTGSSQWHLLGIAMRLCIDMGLHRHNPDWNFAPDEWDIRQRLFWVTYAMDRTVCFNLGRPLTLSDDHIDALFPDADGQKAPDQEPRIGLAVHHIRLRRIQARIISEIYTVGKSRSTGIEDHQRAGVLCSIQSELDRWHGELKTIYSGEQTPHSFQWYERLYYTTTAAVHRATPLFPRPSEESIRRCYEASGNAVRIYYTLLRSHELEHSWILLSGCFLAGITNLYALWSSDALSQSVQLVEVTEICRMCSNVLAVLSAQWKASSEFSDTYESLTNITTKRLVKQLQQRYSSGALYDNDISSSPGQMFSLETSPSLDSLIWPQDFNFHTALVNPQCITEVFDDLLRGQEGLWNV